MRLLRNFALFLLYSNLFIAACALLMVWQTTQFLVDHQPSPDLYGFVGFATICSYSFHWYLTPLTATASSRVHWLKRNKMVHQVFFFIGLAGSVYFGLQLLDHWYLLLLSAFITFLYSAPMIPHPWFRALRKIALGKTVFLAVVWMYVTTLLPLMIGDYPWRTEFTLFAAGRFFLIYAICVLFDYRDREYDISIGIKSLITWLSKKDVKRLFTLSLLLFFFFTICLYYYGYGALDIAILLLPGLITGALYPFATTNSSDILYYFVLDGLMALSAFLFLIKRLKNL